MHIHVEVPSEQRDRISTKLQIKLKAAGTVAAHIVMRVAINPGAGDIGAEVNQIVNDLTLAGAIQVAASG